MLEPDTASRSSLPGDLCQLVRILFLRRSRPGSFSPDVGKLPWLALLYCLLSLGLSVALKGRENGELFIDHTLFTPFGAMIFLAGLLKWMDSRQDGGRIWLVFMLLLLVHPLAAFTSTLAWPFVEGLDFSAYIKPPGFAARFVDMVPNAIVMLPQMWLALAGTFFVARNTYSPNWRRGLYVPLTLAALFFTLMHNYPLGIWRIDITAHLEDGTTTEDGLTLDEDVLYGQPRLLAERLAGIKPGKPGVPEIFFLGVAGSEEGVFMRETITVEQLFKDRYATAGHSLILVNHPSMARTLPFASHESLSQALRHIGRQMNGDEDLLFLFLTSHGTSDHRFSIKLWPLAFSDITPQTLRKALDDSGIENRVVVVSACYSGGFVPDLADDNTLVITAAASDRNSFGCADGNELTDFGRAYFDEALRETRSFTEAFEHAKVTIAQREAADGLMPSQPQIAGGEALRARLEWFAGEK